MPQAFSLTYGIRAESVEKAKEKGREQVFDDVGAGIEHEILYTDVAQENSPFTVQVDVKVPSDIPAPEHLFSTAETIETAAYTFKE